MVNRRIERAIISGNVTPKIKISKKKGGKSFTIPEFNWSITTSLESWGFSWPVVQQYISLRK